MSFRGRTVWCSVLVGATLLLGGCGASREGSAPTHLAPARATVAQTPPPAGIAAIQLFHPVALYGAYVEASLTGLRGDLAALAGQLGAGDRNGAERGWLTAHAQWLELGQDDGQYGAFGTLGNAIDGLAAGDPGGNTSPAFTGFHRVELDLFGRGDLPAARADTHTLIGLVNQLTPTAVAADLPLTAVGLDAWILRPHEILEDALRDTLSGDDDEGSHSVLVSLRADVSATRVVLGELSGLIAPRAPSLLPAAHRDLAAIDAAVTAAPANLPVAALPLRARQRIDAAVGAAAETLAPVSELMSISNANS